MYRTSCPPKPTSNEEIPKRKPISSKELVERAAASMFGLWALGLGAICIAFVGHCLFGNGHADPWLVNFLVWVSSCYFGVSMIPGSIIGLIFVGYCFRCAVGKDTFF